jgi:hypothetical protein
MAITYVFGRGRRSALISAEKTSWRCSWLAPSAGCQLNLSISDRMRGR